MELVRGHETAEGNLRDYRLAAREWVAANLEPVDEHEVRRVKGGEFDSADYPPEVMAKNRAIQRRIYEAGYAGITCPKEYGGQGLTTEHEIIFKQEARRYVMPDFGSLMGTTFTICLPVILAHGQPEFLKAIVPRLLAGDQLACEFFSEPSAGSDLAGVRTQAVREGDEWVINGQKLWSTFAHLADWGLALVRTDWDQPKHRGLTWFMVPCDAAGLLIRPVRQINGYNTFCEDFFDDVRIPDRYRVGEVNDGWGVAQTMLFFERGGAMLGAAFGEGPGPLAPDLVPIAAKRGRIADPVIRQKLAQVHINDFVSRALQWRIVQSQAHTQRSDAGLAAYGKLFRGTFDPIRAKLALDIAGQDRAMLWDIGDEDGDALSRAYLDARITSIAGGTNEMQRNGISERVLGMPREPNHELGKSYRQAIKDAKRWGTEQS